MAGRSSQRMGETVLSAAHCLGHCTDVLEDRVCCAFNARQLAFAVKLSKPIQRYPCTWHRHASEANVWALPCPCMQSAMMLFQVIKHLRGAHE
mmetsp:Transcript_9663/g.29280  ORF Transcript_9663/g.29280 Transcript_9663/m.29280 type:complete len:93 (+) Transcript_9663:397-675(+)